MPQENIVSVETMSGQVLRFVIDRPDAIEKQLKAMDPEEYFQRSQLYFNHASILAGIPCDKVALVRFHFPINPGWTFPIGASSAELIDREQFDSQVEVKRVQTRMLLQSAILGTEIFILQRANLVNGAVLHFRIGVKTVPAAIRMQNVESAMALKTYFAFAGNELVVLNRAAVDFWHAFPGPLMAPADSISFSEEMSTTVVEKA